MFGRATITSHARGERIFIAPLECSVTSLQRSGVVHDRPRVIKMQDGTEQTISIVYDMASSASILPPSLANEKNHSLIRVGSCYFGGEGTIKKLVEKTGAHLHARKSEHSREKCFKI